MDESPSFKEILEEEKRKAEECLNKIGNNGCRVEVEDGVYDADFDTNHESKKVWKEKISDISDAIQRCENGNFGICVDCQRKIPKGRLHMLPQAKRCAPCQEAHEKKCGRRYY